MDIENATNIIFHYEIHESREKKKSTTTLSPLPALHSSETLGWGQPGEK